MTEKQKIGIMPGGFNLVHAGHIQAFKEAKKYCDKLVVIVVRDQSKKGHKAYTENIEDRFMKLQAIKYVDEVFPCENEESLLELLKLLDYDMYFLSEEYKQEGFEIGKRIVGLDRLEYVRREHNWSTTGEVNKIRG